MLSNFNNITTKEKGVKHMKKNAKKKKGFTLVELIAVIAILGILAAVIVPRVGNFTSSANKAKIQSQASTVLSAIETYNAQVTDIKEVIGGTTLTNPQISSLIQDDGSAATTLDEKAGADLAKTISKLSSTDTSADKKVLDATYSQLQQLAQTGELPAPEPAPAE